MISFNPHPQARKSLNELELPGPIKKTYYTETACRFDLSNSTNPYARTFGEYPPPDPGDLKALYLRVLENINTARYPQINFPALNTDQALFTVGSIEGIDIVIRAFCEPHKDTIGVLDPTFPAYEHWARIHGLKVKSVPLTGKCFNDFDLQKIIAKNPKLIFICNPNNPTGTMLSRESILKVCHSFPGFVVVDEAYIEFADQPSMLQYLPQTKNLIILRTLSKAWGMAGVRCGIVLADPSIIHTLRYVQIPFGLSMPSQRLIKKCFQNPHRIIDSWEKIKTERDHLFTLLSQMPVIRKIYKSQTNFMLMQLNDFDNYMKKLREADIYVTDCTHAIPDSIKVSVSAPEAHKAFLHCLSL